MRIAQRLFALAILSLPFASALADSSIRLTPYPTLGVVADSHSTVTITAEVRDQNGKAVLDGTRISWDCPQGTFRLPVTTTTRGYCSNVFIAGAVPGEATITAQDITDGGPPTIIKYELAATREELSSAKEYIEIVSNSYMQYTTDTSGLQKIIGAASPGNGVTLRYRGIIIKADDLQYDINNYEVRARKAVLTMGQFQNKKFDDLFIRLKQKSGVGTTLYKGKRPDGIVSEGLGFAFVRKDAAGKAVIAPDEDHYGLIMFNRDDAYPDNENPQSLFRFEDQSHSPSSISARKAIVFPKRTIQFQRAQIYIAGSKITTIPLFEYSLTQATPLVTEQWLGVVDSQVQLNYPYILSMRPGQTSLFRFRTGDEYGRGDTTDHGAFLDYELNWDRGDDMQGGLVYSGIGRNDWAVGLTQFMRLDDRTSLSAQVLSPTGDSFLGSASVNHQFNGFSASLNGDATKTVEGIQYITSDFGATLDKDPIKVGALPVRLNLELTATGAWNQLINESQSGVGGRVRAQSLPLPIDPNTSLMTSFTTSYLVGPNELNGLQYLGTAALSHRFNSSTSMIFTYNFTHDGFNEQAIGEHELSMQGVFNRGNVNFSLAASKSIGFERSSVFGDLSYKVSKLWRIKTGYTFDNYLDTTYLDYNIGFGYKLGWREVGLIWTEQTQRVGIQLLGTTVY